VPSYQISELAHRSGLPPTTLRFYEQAGLLPAARSANGYRHYGEDALARLALIRAGKQLGLPLAELRGLLGLRDGGDCAGVRGRLRPLLAARIEQARAHSAELTDSIARLELALAATEPAPRPGPCDSGCGCLTEPRPAGQLPQPAGQPPLACSLTGADQGVRAQAWHDLFAQATAREPVPGGVRFTLPAALAGAAAELAAAEQRCCPFFRFTLVFAGGGVQLTAQAPAAAGPLLAGLTDEPAAPV
jgi:MerR family copper efflux transcriptional regulator